MNNNWCLFLIIYFTIVSCKDYSKKSTTKNLNRNEVINDSILLKDSVNNTLIHPIIGELEQQLINKGLVNIQKVDSSIMVDLRYTTTNNFVGVDLYGDLNYAYCQKDVAKKLVEAQKLLKEIDSSYSLLVFDAARPKSVQQKMWDTLKMPISEKIKFVSNPKNHSIHNYGAAIDLSLAKNGVEVDMGTPFDHIGKLAYPTQESYFLKTGELTQEQMNHRKLLRKVMKQAGFTGLNTEWWHFNSCKRVTAKEKYSLIE